MYLFLSKGSSSRENVKKQKPNCGLTTNNINSSLCKIMPMELLKTRKPIKVCTSENIPNFFITDKPSRSMSLK